MKKIKTMRLASVLLIAVLLSTCVISGTFAKYASIVSATDSAIVANFEVTAFDKEGTVAPQIVDVDIFSTIYDTEGTTDYVNETTTENEVVNVGDDVIIAPGTWGKFTYTLTNSSDVTVKYAIDYQADEAGVPLEWSIDGSTWTDNLADVAASDATKLAMTTGNTDITIYWRWNFEGGITGTGDAWNDGHDTALGTAGTLAQPSLTIAVSFEQVD